MKKIVPLLFLTSLTLLFSSCLATQLAYAVATENTDVTLYVEKGTVSVKTSLQSDPAAGKESWQRNETSLESSSGMKPEYEKDYGILTEGETLEIQVRKGQNVKFFFLSLGSEDAEVTISSSSGKDTVIIKSTDLLGKVWNFNYTR